MMRGFIEEETYRDFFQTSDVQGGKGEWRGEKLRDEYRTPLALLDERYHGTQQGEVGPLVQRLESYTGCPKKNATPIFPYISLCVNATGPCS